MSLRSFDFDWFVMRLLTFDSFLKWPFVVGEFLSRSFGKNSFLRRPLVLDWFLKHSTEITSLPVVRPAT